MFDHAKNEIPEDVLRIVVIHLLMSHDATSNCDCQAAVFIFILFPN